MKIPKLKSIQPQIEINTILNSFSFFSIEYLKFHLSFYLLRFSAAPAISLSLRKFSVTVSHCLGLLSLLRRRSVLLPDCNAGSTPPSLNCCTAAVLRAATAPLFPISLSLSALRSVLRRQRRRARKLSSLPIFFSHRRCDSPQPRLSIIAVDQPAPLNGCCCFPPAVAVRDPAQSRRRITAAARS